MQSAATGRKAANIDADGKFVTRHANKIHRLMGGAAIFAAAVSMGLPSGSALAQTAPTLLVMPRAVESVTVTPPVADIGVAREIKISGFWNGCPPVGAQQVDAGERQPGTRVIRMILPMTFAPCAAVLPYSVSLSITPAKRGIDRLVIQNVDGAYLAEALLDTRAPDDNRAAYNITGMWYDPASNGSGLTFVHSRLNDNVVFGTWFVYDASGKPRWYTIQNTVWTAQGRVLEGSLYETDAAADCPLPFNACPAAFSHVTLTGKVRFTITGANSARIDALTATGAVAFTSNVIRAEI